MKRTSLLVISLMTFSACGTAPIAPDVGGPAGEPQVESDAAPAPLPPEVTPASEVPVAAAPGLCEQLLEQLQQTQPLLTDLDQRLAGQAKRLEKAVDRLHQPPPPPPAPVECEAALDALPDDKMIIGAIEWIFMNPPGRHYRARVDSGAETSSLSAGDVVEFERDGKDWVRFSFDHDGEDDVARIELPISRTVLIRQASSDEPSRRVVVQLDIRLGEQLQNTEFTLTDRSAMTYPVLLGRAFLLDLYVVDVSREYIRDKFRAPGL